MLIEIYKGVEITHNATKDIFSTTLVINQRHSKGDEVIGGPRLQKVRDDIDKFLNQVTKKPVLKKGWLKRRGDYDYSPVEIIIYNPIPKNVMVKEIKNGQITWVKLDSNYNSDYRIVLDCKENNEIIKGLLKKHEEIEKIKKEVSCSSGKIIPLTIEHFK